MDIPRRVKLIRALNQFPKTMLAERFNYSAATISRIIANHIHHDPKYVPPKTLTPLDLEYAARAAERLLDDRE